MSDEKLLPCPFCGGAAEWNEVLPTRPPIAWRRIKVTCRACSAGAAIQKDQHDAFAAWNKRADTSAAIYASGSDFGTSIACRAAEAQGAACIAPHECSVPGNLARLRKSVQPLASPSPPQPEPAAAERPLSERIRPMLDFHNGPAVADEVATLERQLAAAREEIERLRARREEKA